MKKIIRVLTAAAPLICLAGFLLISSGAAAAGGGHAGDVGHIPFDKIGWQAANLGILLIGIFYVIKTPLVEAFKARQKNYIEQSEKTKSSLKDAEAALIEEKTKLMDLEAGEKSALEHARREADLLKAQLISDAVAAAEKIKLEAEIAIKRELSKAKASINSAILNQALATAATSLREKGQTSAAEKAGHEAAFVKQIESVII